MRRCPSSGGWLLVGLIILVTAAGIGLAGATLFLTSHQRATSLRALQTRAYYLAQAGVMQAVYDFRELAGGTGYTLGQVIVDDNPASADDDVFVLEAVGSDGLLVNLKPGTLPAATTICAASRSRLTGWRLRSVLLSASPATTIDRVAVDWAPVLAGETVIRIDLGGAQRWPLPAGTCSSVGPNVFADLVPNYAIAPGAVVAGANTIWFSTTGFRAGGGTTTKTFIDLKFQLLDGSVRVARFVNAVGSRASSFSLTTVGRAGRGPMPFASCRRARVEYRICNSVTSANECDDATEERITSGKIHLVRDEGTRCP